jgi:hypothetical protein
VRKVFLALALLLGSIPVLAQNQTSIRTGRGAPTGPCAGKEPIYVDQSAGIACVCRNNTYVNSTSVPQTTKGLGSPVVSFAHTGTPGSTTNQYAVVGTDSLGNTRSLYASDATANATLNGTNFTTVTVAAWPTTGNFVAPVGACNVYRTTSGGTPSSTGKIGTIASCAAGGSLQDKGLAGDSTTPPADTSGVMTAQLINVTGGCGGAVTQYSFPTCVTISVAGRATTDLAPICIIDSNLAGQLLCTVVKSNGQTEWLYGNSGCVADAQVNSAGNVMTSGPVSASGNCDNDLTTLNGNIHLAPGTLGNIVSVDSPLASGAVKATGTGAAITGTGACATFTATVSNGFAADAICSGTTGASTIVITPAAGTPAASTSLNCWGDDTTTGHLLKGIQSGAGTSTCTVSFTSVTTGDFLTVHWEIL